MIRRTLFLGTTLALGVLAGLLAEPAASRGWPGAPRPLVAGAAARVAEADPTPSCPGGAEPGAAPNAPCSAVKVHGNTYQDKNRNGRYDPNTGDTRLPGVSVRLLDAATRTELGHQVTNQNGYYSFPLLPVGPTYIVEVAVPAGFEPTTPTWRELELRDFSTYWCCSARADFGFRGGVPPTVPCCGPVVPPSGTPIPPPCCDRPSGRQIHLPILNYGGTDNVCTSIIEVQNVGAWPSKAILLVWGAPGACPPQCAGPLKVECSGLLAPGSTWNFLGAQLPSRTKGAMVFSAPALGVPGIANGTGDVFADLLCETLFRTVVGSCDEFRRFKLAFNAETLWQAPGGALFDFGQYPGAAMAVEVVRKCPGDMNPMVSVTGGYAGLADELLGAYDPVYGGYAFYAPLVYADRNGFTSWLYIQNGGTECTSLEIWFKAQNDCLRPQVCDVANLAPGETYQFDAASCVGPDWIGSAYVRGSQPLGMVVDTVGLDLLTSYHGVPAELKYNFDGPAVFTASSEIAYGPLLYSEYQGWDSLVQVQNLSTVTNAKVKVYFLDRSGDIITTLTDWICPGGSQSYSLPIVTNLPGNWVGSVRVESQNWFAPGAPSVPAPAVAGVVQMIKYADVARAQPLEAVAYELLPEQRAFDWQIGSGWGGLYSGVAVIGIPSLMKDVQGTGLTTELAIANLVPKPGFTDFVIYIYDQNGLVDSLCQKLDAKQVEYLDLASQMAFLPDGFKGSAVISAVFWEHDVWDEGGRFLRNLVGLAAVKLERTGTILGADIPGDESAASEGFPLVGPFAFAGPRIACPGVPVGIPCCQPGHPGPGPRPPIYPTATAGPTNVPPPFATATPELPTPPGPPTPPPPP
jgi:hypothetical protein